MSHKISQGRISSVRNNLQRRYSKQGFGSSFTKQQLYRFESDPKILESQSMPSTQNQIAKKIQNKLRMRKPSASEKKLKQTMNSKDTYLMIQTKTDFITDLRDEIDNLWENNQAVYDTLTSWGVKQSSGDLKQEIIIKQSNLILCQISKGQNLENILVERLTKKLSKLKCIKKCEQKQKFVNSMFNSRMQILSLALRTK